MKLVIKPIPDRYYKARIPVVEGEVVLPVRPATKPYKLRIQPKAQKLRSGPKQTLCRYCSQSYVIAYSNTQFCSQYCHKSMYGKDAYKHECSYCGKLSRRLYCSEECRKAFEAIAVSQAVLDQPDQVHVTGKEGMTSVPQRPSDEHWFSEHQDN